MTVEKYLWCSSCSTRLIAGDSLLNDYRRRLAWFLLPISISHFYYHLCRSLLFQPISYILRPSTDLLVAILQLLAIRMIQSCYCNASSMLYHNISDYDAMHHKFYIMIIMNNIISYNVYLKYILYHNISDYDAMHLISLIKPTNHPMHHLY